MRRLILVLWLALLVAGVADAQEILLDQMVEAGGLKCYPVHGDDTSWYYLPDQPQVADGDTGRPQFSFLMYSSPEQRGEEGITEAPGGGVAHMLVAYDVPEDMVRRAQGELARVKPGAQLKGPVAYTDGTFNLVTAVTDPEAGMSRRVVGVGNAPVMSGHKAAVSMHLTPTGAMLLWESFSQRTPDISVNFEMTVSGYRNPVEAQMTFDYERIHRTIEIEAGIEASFIEADVDVMLGKMVDNGAITIELKGAPPEQWQEVQKLGLELAKHHLFENLGAAPMSQVRELTRSRGANRRSALDEPITESIIMIAGPPPPDEDELSDETRARAREYFDRGIQLYDQGRYDEGIHVFEQAYDLVRHPLLAWNIYGGYLARRRTDDALTWLNDVLEISEEARESALFSQLLESVQAADLRQMTDEMYNELVALSEEVFDELRPIWLAYLRTDSDTAEDAAPTSSSSSPTDSPDDSAEDTGPAPGGLRDSPFDDEGPGGATAAPATAAATRGAASDTGSDRESAATGRTPSRRERSGGPSGGQQARGGGGGGSNFQISIAFRYRKIQRSGTFTFNMRQWNRVEIPVRFAANVGDLSRYMNDQRMFRRVSLNDPMFKQREIPVTVDVASEEVFADMLNAVTVTLKKRHESGAETLDEVTIQRSGFSSGEVPTVVYGWDGDDDRDRWLEYDHRVRWSYAGGPVVETDWQATTAGALVLEPPLRPREVFLEADPDILREQGVRDVVVEVRYPAGDTERLAHATLRPKDDVGQKTLRLYQDPQTPGYTYSFDWRLYGGRRVEAGPFEDTADFIYVDEIPEE
jgi:tetratricopeptide (TPR) repeat protein